LPSRNRGTGSYVNLKEKDRSGKLIPGNNKFADISKNSSAHKRFQSLRHKRLANGMTLEDAIRVGGDVVSSIPDLRNVMINSQSYSVADDVVIVT